MLSGSSVAVVPSDVGQLLGLVSVLVYLGQRPDKARPFVRLGYADLLADVEDLHLALRVPGGDLLASVGPSDTVQRCRSVHKHTGSGNLRVVVQVPQVEAAGEVHAGKQRRVCRRPHGIVDVITAVLEGVQGAGALGAPEFNRPVKGGGDEEVGKVHWPSGAVAAQASDWTMMALEHLGDARLTTTHGNTKDFLFLFFCIC